MAQVRMRLDSENIYVDDVANTATMTLYAQESETPQPAPGFNWYSISVPQVTLVMPISRKANVTNQFNVLASVGADGQFVYTRWELVNGTWVNRGVCNSDGTQPVKA